MIFFRLQITLKAGVIGKIALRDFKGLEDKCDASTRQMVLDFSFNLALGNISAAFRYFILVIENFVNANVFLVCKMS